MLQAIHEIVTNDQLAETQLKLSEKDKIFTVYTLHKGKCVKGMSPDHSGAVFLTQGKIRVTSICTDKQQIAHEAEMFLVPRGRTFHFYALEDTQILTCNITVTVAFCQEHPIGQLLKYEKYIPESLKQNEFGLLPIRPHLFQEVKITQQVITDQLDYEDFQNLKRELFLLYMRYTYTPVERAFFFLPLLNEDMRFLSKVLSIYQPNITAQEFIDLSGMSASTFNRRFRKSFNMSLGNWLNRKKRDEIKEDLILSDLSIQDIAEKHLFTPNHLRKFCKMHFDQSPSEIREYYNSGMAYEEPPL